MRYYALSKRLTNQCRREILCPCVSDPFYADCTAKLIRFLHPSKLFENFFQKKSPYPRGRGEIAGFTKL